MLATKMEARVVLGEVAVGNLPDLRILLRHLDRPHLPRQDRQDLDFRPPPEVVIAEAAGAGDDKKSSEIFGTEQGQWPMSTETSTFSFSNTTFLSFSSHFFTLHHFFKQILNYHLSVSVHKYFRNSNEFLLINGMQFFYLKI